MTNINWNKPLVTINGTPIISVGKLLHSPSNGFNMMCVVDVLDGNYKDVIYVDEKTGYDKDGACVVNKLMKLDWTKPLFTVIGNKPCRMVFDGVKTKYDDVRYLILVTTSPGGLENETLIVNEYGMSGAGVERVRNVVDFYK